MKNNIFGMMPVDLAYIRALTELVNACQSNNVMIDKVNFFNNGWHVTFKGHKGADAICHDSSYGSPYCMSSLYDEAHNNDWSKEARWETVGFPWDSDDVSVHDANELARYLRALNDGKVVWEDD